MRSACRRSPSAAGVQSVFTVEANRAIGIASRPMAETPRFRHSTRVVPVPQKGSSATVPGPAPNSSR